MVYCRLPNSPYFDTLLIRIARTPSCPPSTEERPMPSPQAARRRIRPAQCKAKGCTDEAVRHDDKEQRLQPLGIERKRILRGRAGGVLGDVLQLGDPGDPEADSRCGQTYRE